MRTSAGLLLLFIQLLRTADTSQLPDRSYGSLSLKDSFKCSTCLTLGAMVVAGVRLTKSSGLLRTNAAFVCHALPVSREICTAYIDHWAEAITYILVHSRLSMFDMCSIYLDSCPRRQLAIDIDLDLPEAPGSSFAQLRHDNYPSPAIPGIRVLHIADIHVDFQYTEGADNSCADILCCRAEHGFPDDVKRKAGRWGDYTRCDAPYRLLLSMIKHAAERHKDGLAYILWTGDNAPHDSWKTSREEVLAATKNVTALLQHYFPGVPVIPVIGNHDSAPTDSFPPPEVWRDGFSVAWLYSELAHLWKPWLPAQAVATLGSSGFYSVPVRPDSPPDLTNVTLHSAVATLGSSGFYSVLVRPGFRIIVINTNVAYKFNFWVVLTAQQDPYHQLKWLTEELRAAQMSGEKVHVVGHISPADPDILPGWSHVYHGIIERYQDTVTAQFFSHTHLDEIQLARDAAGEPFSVAYVAPSLTPWKNVNPGYKIYAVDGARGNQSTWEVTDVARWTADLAKANAEPDLGAHWSLQYIAGAVYSLDTFSPRNWDSMITDLLLVDRFFAKYYRNLSGRSSAQEMCGSECRQRVVCDIVTSDRSSNLPCLLARATFLAGLPVGHTPPGSPSRA